jgi:hypothetical protein
LTLPKKARSREIDDCSKERLNKNNFWQRTTITKESSFFMNRKVGRGRLLLLKQQKRQDELINRNILTTWQKQQRQQSLRDMPYASINFGLCY